MKYKPIQIGKRWTTALCESNGNGGIHDQTQLKSAIKMLEDAVATWDSPKLMHLILTGASVSTYNLFIDSMKRALPGVKAYKSAVEKDTRKSQHVHLMLVTDAATPISLFDLDNDSSAISRIVTKLRRTEPEFDVTVAQPRKYAATPYIPLDAATLHDAVDWFSYALKARSKPPAGVGIRCDVYGSSRRRVTSSQCAAKFSASLGAGGNFSLYSRHKISRLFALKRATNYR